MDGVPDWLIRLGQERDELSAKMGKLNEYIFRNPAFDALLVEDRMLLRQQYLAMEQYRTILDIRLRNAIRV